MQISSFGITQNGDAVNRYVLHGDGIEVALLSYGGTIQSLKVPARNGTMVDVVLGFDSMAGYQADAHTMFLGALIGRCGNRIANGAFTLEGKAYALRKNDGKNHLHGGIGYDKRIWDAAPVENGVAFHLLSPDGEEGYPGNLDITITYTLEGRALVIDYVAKTDAVTLCNLTNHAYFNLSGHEDGNICDHTLQLFADCYTPTDDTSIPTGAIAPVRGTPMDFLDGHPIGTRVDAPFEQLTLAGGYDHNYCVNQTTQGLNLAASVISPKTGIVMEMETTLPGIQFYSGNYLDGCPSGKSGAVYKKRAGFCLETQLYPDAIHHENFAQPILRPGETYHHKTIYRFSHQK